MISTGTTTMDTSEQSLQEMVIDDEDDSEESRETSKHYRAALRWLKNGYNAVPQSLDGSKHPGVIWKEFQERRVTRAELLDWHSLFARGVGFITGAVSGVIVIETDGPEGKALLAEFERQYGPLPETRIIRSGSGRGLHYHFKHPGHFVTTKANPSIKLDVKGDKGFCMLPPSGHKSGGHYEVVHNAEPADLPPKLLEFIEAKAAAADGTTNGAQRRPKGSVRSEVALPDYMRDLDLVPNTLRKEVKAPPVETMRAMLEFLKSKSAFEGREGQLKDEGGRIIKVGWMETGMALKPAYGDKVGFDLWGVTHMDDRARKDAPAQWASFHAEVRPNDIGIGTIIKVAKDSGFVFNVPSTVVCTTDVEQFTGRGADVWNGKKFAEMYRGRLLYVYETGEWLRFSPEQGWVAALHGEAERAAKEVLKVLGEEATERWKVNPLDPVAKQLMKHVERTSEARNIRAMIEMAKSEPGMTVRLSEFDNDPMLLGVTNGVLDLTKGELLPISPGLLVSKRCKVAYDPGAECPRFKQFLREVQPDLDVRRFLQRLMGYCLTGSVDEQVFAFFYGRGANGKSVFVELFAWILGDYARKTTTEMLMDHPRNPQGPSPDIVSLKGKRLVYANETEEGRRLAEARVKELTGGDTLTGRVVYGKADISFAPTHKLVIVGNHKPEITDTSHGMWRRVILTPFDQTIPETNRDPKLLETLKGEGSGILNGMLAGLQEWRKNGLQIPKEITTATASYRDEQDILGDWIGERCTTGGGLSEQKGLLYFDYKNWAERNGHRPLAKGKLTRRLNERGYKVAPDKRTVHGLALK